MHSRRKVSSLLEAVQGRHGKGGAVSHHRIRRRGNLGPTTYVGYQAAFSACSGMPITCRRSCHRHS
jgi:hypothetical protein